MFLSSFLYQVIITENVSPLSNNEQKNVDFFIKNFLMPTITYLKCAIPHIPPQHILLRIG